MLMSNREETLSCVAMRTMFTFVRRHRAPPPTLSSSHRRQCKACIISSGCFLQHSTPVVWRRVTSPRLSDRSQAKHTTFLWGRRERSFSQFQTRWSRLQYLAELHEVHRRETQEGGRDMPFGRLAIGNFSSSGSHSQPCLQRQAAQRRAMSDFPECGESDRGRLWRRHVVKPCDTRLQSSKRALEILFIPQAAASIACIPRFFIEWDMA